MRVRKHMRMYSVVGLLSYSCVFASGCVSLFQLGKIKLNNRETLDSISWQDEYPAAFITLFYSYTPPDLVESQGLCCLMMEIDLQS